MGEGAVSEVGPVMSDKGIDKRSVVIALLGGDTHSPQIIKGKLIGSLTALGDGLEPYTRVRWIGTYRLWEIEGKLFPTVTLSEIEKVGAFSRQEPAA